MHIVAPCFISKRVLSYREHLPNSSPDAPISSIYTTHSSSLSLSQIAANARSARIDGTGRNMRCSPHKLKRNCPSPRSFAGTFCKRSLLINQKQTAATPLSDEAMAEYTTTTKLFLLLPAAQIYFFTSSILFLASSPLLMIVICVPIDNERAKSLSLVEGECDLAGFPTF